MNVSKRFLQLLLATALAGLYFLALPVAQADPANDLTGMIPTGYSSDSCKTVDPPASRAVATVDCFNNSDPGGAAAARYSLYQNTADVAYGFQSSTGDDQLVNCPGQDTSPGTWHYKNAPDQTAGQVACGIYQGKNEVMWTNDQKLFLGTAQGTDLNALYSWWENSARA
ncbi:hypothetical protein FOS14_18385 [Skermania sp. ID1734]|uniref:hypothetical protein n=1 Tax=Skermania sp. ID1734 TaxID=2597516 RepID=UPI00117C272D|nr:hypothetical protein [Skermania sp. ID1734]TSD95329.1 hypothetical protein FOS14_18385 [Skermania sp. ID1734]